MRIARRCFECVIAPTLLVAIAGCSSNDVPLGAVSGHVTKNGKPQPNLWLEFKPTHGGRPSTARTDASGSYTLAYTPQKSGALVGQHKVRLGSGGEVNGYGDVKPETELHSEEVEVKPGANTINFDLK
jgi:hypothetical protein